MRYVLFLFSAVTTREAYTVGTGPRTVVAYDLGVKETMLRPIGALARSRGAAVLLRPLGGDLPAGLAHLRLEAQQVSWEGADAGHGRLRRRRLVVEASGKATGGMRRLYEVEDDGAHSLRVVPGLAPAPALGGTAV